MAETRQLIANAFKAEDRDFRHAYVESFLNSRIALQIRSNRKARRWTQKQLAKKAGMHQSQIPPLENIDNESWTISTLLKIARGFDLVLIVKFASFGEALEDFSSAAPEELVRPSFDDDPTFKTPASGTARLTTAVQPIWPLDFDVGVYAPATMERPRVMLRPLFRGESFAVPPEQEEAHG